MNVREMVGGLIPPKGPVRVLVWSMLGRSIGHGILLSVVVLFFTRSVHISAAELGVGLTVAAILKILVSVPAGNMTDRMGSRRAAIVFVILQGVLVASYALADGFVGFIATASLVGMAESASEAARGALIAGVIPAEGRVRARAYLKSVNNIGISLGSVFGGVALSFDTRMFYSVLLVTCGALLVIGGLVYIALPPVERIPRPEGGRKWEALRDPQYMVFGLINAILVMNTGILAVALPLWIVERTSAPAAMYSVILVLNTVMVVLFQVRASRGVGGRQGRRSRAGPLWRAARGVLRPVRARRGTAGVARRGAPRRGRGGARLRRAALQRGNLGAGLRTGSRARAGPVPGGVRDDDQPGQHADPGLGHRAHHRDRLAGLAGVRRGDAGRRPGGTRRRPVGAAHEIRGRAPTLLTETRKSWISACSTSPTTAVPSTATVTSCCWPARVSPTPTASRRCGHPSVTFTRSADSTPTRR